MQKTINQRNAIVLTALVIVGTNMVSGFPGDLRQDQWVAILLSLVLAIPLMLLFARVTKLAPELTIGDKFELAFGKIAGKTACILFAFFAIVLMALVVVNDTTFMRLISLENTPLPITALLFVLPAIYLSKSGPMTIGKVGAFLFFVSLAAVALTFFVTVYAMDFSNLLPILYVEPQKLVIGTLELIPYPFADAVILIALFSGGMQDDVSPNKVFIGGLLIAVFFILSTLIRALTILGPEYYAATLYPHYEAVSVGLTNHFLQRMEAIIGFVYVWFGMIKVGICGYAASVCVAHVIGGKNHRSVAAPVCLFGAALSAALFKNDLQMLSFVYPYLIGAPFFQVLLPLMLWIALEIKLRRKKMPQTV